MATHNFDRLTGGTFMLLVEKAKKREHKKRDSLSGKSDGLNNQELLKALIRIFDPTYKEPPQSTFAQNTSAYRSCSLDQGTYLPFDQDHLITRFDDEVQHNYGKPLDRMIRFVDRFIDTENQSQLLANHVIALIIADDTINNTKPLFVQPNGDPIRKNNLKTLDIVELDALLLGAWHYIITNVPKNVEGRATYEHWNSKPATQNSRWKLCSDNLPKIDFLVNVTRSAIIDNPKRNESANDSEIIDIEVVYNEETSSESESAAKPNFGAAQESRITVFQGGTNNTNIGYVETLNLGQQS